IDGEVFKVRCIIEPKGEWRLSVVECVSPNGIAVPIVPMCDERIVDGRIYQCKKHVNGSVDFLQRDDTKIPCDGHPYGSLWKEDSLQFGCGKGGMKDFMGCITSSGMFIPSGEVKWVDGVQIECMRHANGTIMMNVLDRLTRTTCKDNRGKERNEGNLLVTLATVLIIAPVQELVWKTGTTWNKELLQYRCGKGGVIELMGCITTSGQLIPIGTVKSVSS
ncbi:unnamed protein product, partial [Angiostrongylus costaricensis]|uniref:Sushi domain-containing protein n=1 Tax=Angiostrongylus costaricensis TaxID=334426 RepID=A0A0R3PBM1_ANGCS